MDPQQMFYHNPDCPARGKVGRDRAIACKYCVGLTHFDGENHLLFHTAYDSDFGR